MREPYGILFDAQRCIGCRQCVRQCQMEHDQLVSIDGDLTFDRFTSVTKHGELYSRRLCMHCINPACASACPVGALEKKPWGPVVWHEEKCIGCRYCMMACPFKVPKYEWESRNPRVGKCDMCIHRTEHGDETACSFVCPTGATISGPRSELIARARRRVQKYSECYFPGIYGLREVGGTSVLLISCSAFGHIGYPENLLHEPLPTLTWNVLHKLPNLVLTGGVLLGGVYWIVSRRMQLQHQPEEEPKS